MFYMREPWEERAACSGVDHADLIFFEKKFHKQAKDICYKCPVRESCYTLAMREMLLDGVWGGFDSEQRVFIRRHVENHDSLTLTEIESACAALSTGSLSLAKLFKYERNVLWT
jgi:WhiB family redox-sensing transcriptional regulator